MQNKHYFFFLFGNPNVRGEVMPVGPNSQLLPKICFARKHNPPVSFCSVAAEEQERVYVYRHHTGVSKVCSYPNVLKWVSSISAIACLALTCTVAAPPRIQRILDLAQFSAQVMNFRERSITESGAKNVTFY